MVAAVRPVSFYVVRRDEDHAATCEGCGDDLGTHATVGAGLLYCSKDCARADLKVRRELVERDEDSSGADWTIYGQVLA